MNGVKLEFKDIEENKELLPQSVYDYIVSQGLSKAIRVAKIDPAFADGEALSKEYDIPYEMELNCLVVEGRRGEAVRYAGLVLPYGRRANMNSKVRGPLDVKKVSFADLEYVTKVSGMEYGSITPIGLPEDFVILLEKEVLDREQVIVGGGLACSKLLFDPKLFLNMKNCVIVEGIAKEE